MCRLRQILSVTSRQATLNRCCRQSSVRLQLMTTVWMFACTQRRVASSVMQLEAGADAHSFAAMSCLFPHAANIRGPNEVMHNPPLETPDMRIDAAPQVSAFLMLSRYFQTFKRVCHMFPLPHVSSHRQDRAHVASSACFLIFTCVNLRRKRKGYGDRSLQMLVANILLLASAAAAAAAAVVH